MRVLLVFFGLAVGLMFAEVASAGQTLYKSGSKGGSRVELFTTAWCPYCRNAENFLRANGIDFVKHDIEKDPAAARRKAQLDGRKGVPLAVIDGQVVYGFSEQMYRTALGLTD